jgi:HAD superfamily hydrolase (TIGR01509 family)
MSGQQLVIFDCDGVLVNSVGISCEVLARSLTAAGLPITAAEARRDYVELLLADVVSRAQAKLGHALPVGWLEDYESARAQAFALELRPVRGAAKAVRRVGAAGVGVCVASQGKVEQTRLSLSLTGLRGLFAEEALFSAYEVLRGKPDPDLLLHAARVMNAPPGRCAVIEDTTSGVEAAVSARMRAIGYAAAGTRAAADAAGGDTEALRAATERALRAAGAAEVLRSMGELPSVLGVAG